MDTRTEEIRARAVQMARRHGHSGEASDKDMKAASLVLEKEGLNDEEIDSFWAFYKEEYGAVRSAVVLTDKAWQDDARRIVIDLIGNGLTVRDLRRPSVATAEKLRGVLFEDGDYQRLPGRRQVEVSALVVDAALAWMKERNAKVTLWQDLRTVLGSIEDRGEGDRQALVAAAKVCGRAVLALLGPSSLGETTVRALDTHTSRELFSLRMQLRYKAQVIGSDEKRAAEAAADALCHMLRAADDGDLAVHVPGAWSSAHDAIAAAYDGLALSRRRAELQLQVLAALPESLRHALGVSDETECQLRSVVPERKAS